MTKNKIGWESWNVKEQELIEQRNIQYKNLLTEPGNSHEGNFEEEYDGGSMIEVSIPHIDTPFGVFPTNSIFKPSDRWECWIGHTNFPIGQKCLKILNESIPGVEALSIMGAYTFCIGVAKLFDSSVIKKNIEQVFCGDINDRDELRGSVEQ
jgi:hypothetical protein